ncbi:MAG: hypothetical protein ACOC56_00705 [Atribacterota bacterium]
MEIVSALGGGGSTFIIDALNVQNYTPVFGEYTPYNKWEKFRKHQWMVPIYLFLMKTTGNYKDKIRVISRPDAFWTDWKYFPKAEYNPKMCDFKKDLEKQREYIIENIYRRSGGIRVNKNKIKIKTLEDLVRTYVNEITKKEKKKKYLVVLVSGHWGEYGVFKSLGYKTIYLIRDPFNSLISHSKKIRHEAEYKRRGFKNVNDKRWIDSYLNGHSHKWINHAKTALEHKNSLIIRYKYFKKDWKEKIKNLPDITNKFEYSENNIRDYLTKESIEYIKNKTSYLCEKLRIDISV